MRELEIYGTIKNTDKEVNKYMEKRKTLPDSKVKEVGKKARSKMFGVIYSRTAIVILLLLLEIGFFLYLISGASKNTNYLYGLSIIMTVITIIYIINEEGNPSFKLTWIIFVAAFPLAGVAFYLYTKLELTRKILTNRMNDLKMETEPYMRQNDNVVRAMSSSRLANVNLT